MGMDRDTLRKAERCYRMVDHLNESIGKVECAQSLGCCETEGSPAYGYLSSNVVASTNSEATEAIRMIMLTSLRADLAKVSADLSALGFNPEAPGPVRNNHSIQSKGPLRPNLVV